MGELRTPIGNVDASWLRMDEPANLMVVTGVLVFGAPVEQERIRQLVAERLLRFDRFRQRAVRPFAGVGTPAWEHDPDFSLDHHLTIAELDAPGDEGALQGFVSRLLSRAFHPGRPLWELHFLPRYEGGSALVVRIHHCIGDGLALVHVLLTLADGEPAADIPGKPHLPRARFWTGLGPRLVRAGRALRGSPGQLAREARALLADPGRLRRGGALVAGHLGSLASILLLPSDPATHLKGPLAVDKRVAWSRPYRLDDFKAIGRLTGSTVNDVLMAALAGGLRRYLLEHGEVPPGFGVRGVVPVNLRRPGEAHLLGNRFGLVFLGLPLGLEDALERLFEIRKRMQALKSSPQAVAVFELLWALGPAPQRLFDLAVRIFGAKATMVVTNVAGPRSPISIAGSPLRQAMFWVPSAGRLGLGVSLLSYAGQVWLGVQSDAGLIPDPDRILACFGDEVQTLLGLLAEVGEAAGG